MEESVIREAENCGRSDSIFLFKPSKSFVEMGSMKPVNAEKGENGRCGHFTMR